MGQVFDNHARELAQQVYQADEAWKHAAETRPSMMFVPHDRGQIQALESDRVYRILIPGNGWGKTTCMACDADLLMQRADFYKHQVMPAASGGDRPTTAVWFCQKYQQWEIMQPAVEAMLTRPFRWRSQQHYYEWPNGSRLFILSSDSDWTAIQGIELDAVYFDEHPDRKFWVEMQFRRRGEKQTRYMVAATMTKGITWFIQQIVMPWEKSIRDAGLTLTEGMQQQPHPKTFIWASGGISDNPAMTEADIEHYATIEGASVKELEVRQRGGYADFTGTPVFNLASLTEMEREHAATGESGTIIFTPDEDPEAQDRLLVAAAAENGQSLGHRFNGVVDRQFYRWLPGAELEGGRITIFEPPDPDQAGNYVIGADFAAGLEGMDYDAGMVGLKTANGQVVQVAEAHGHWGDVFFAEVLFMLGVLYFEAFICGERQFGLPTLRRLHDEMGYTYLYSQRVENSRARRFSDLLGHHRGQGDTIIPMHRLAVTRQDVLLLSPDAIREHKRYQFRPRRRHDVIDDLERSSDLITSAPSGENDDLVMGAAYMTHAAREIVHYPKPKRDYRRGTFGDVMGLSSTLNPKRKKRDPYKL